MKFLCFELSSLYLPFPLVLMKVVQSKHSWEVMALVSTPEPEP